MEQFILKQHLGQKGIHKRHKKVFYFNENENDISDL